MSTGHHSFMGAPIRVMTVDDHPIFRDGLAAMLSVHEDFDLVAEAGDGAEAVEKFRAHKPDVTLMDLSMPRMSGAEAIQRIVTEFPQARIIAVTTFVGDADVHRALEAGARGYLIKDALRHDVAQAIRAVHKGDKVLPAAVAQRLAEYTPRADLTGREIEVLTHMMDGLSNKEIAGAIGRTEATVKAHLLNVFEKLGASDRTEAVTIALRRGIVHLPDK